MNIQRTPVKVFLTGDNSRLMASVAVCLINGGSDIMIRGTDNKFINDFITRVFSTHGALSYHQNANDHFRLTDTLADAADADMAIVLASEKIESKHSFIYDLEKVMQHGRAILCNMESIRLDELQKKALFPARLIGANWSEPVFTSGFLELITNQNSSAALAGEIAEIARRWWRKEPYILKDGYSVRSRLMCSILREAFFLVQNKYADVEDIDRACRNDAGYYLSFAGNFRYMDLMGLYAYGVVMNDLNPELSKETQPPLFFNEMMRRKEYGMKSGKGFYEYAEGRNACFENDFEHFSFEIDKIIRRYPLIK